MRIGIDMRMAGSGEGIGRYSEELAAHLGQIDSENEYFLIVNANSNFQPPADRPWADNFQIVKVKSKYYSFAEQTYFIWELMRLKLDLMHFTSFNVPVFYPGKFVVTIHDIIHHHFPGKKKSRLLHRAAYRAVIWCAARRARRVIAISKSTADDVMRAFGVARQKITVVYEGISEKFFEPIGPDRIAGVKKQYNIEKPYILFTGVWRQYKNLPKLAQAFDILKDKYSIDSQLVLAGKIDPFYPEIKKEVMDIKNSADIRPLGFVTEQDLPALYQGAKVFVLPSLLEGFGLIGIEAQASGAPVAASDIPVLREVLGDSARYFNPHDEQDMARVIAGLWSSASAGRAGQDNARKYSWAMTARSTLQIYQTCAR